MVQPLHNDVPQKLIIRALIRMVSVRQSSPLFADSKMIPGCNKKTNFVRHPQACSRYLGQACSRFGHSHTPPLGAILPMSLTAISHQVLPATQSESQHNC